MRNGGGEEVVWGVRLPNTPSGVTAAAAGGAAAGAGIARTPTRRQVEIRGRDVPVLRVQLYFLANEKKRCERAIYQCY